MAKFPTQKQDYSAPRTGRTTLDIYQDMGLAALQGATLGFSDEIISAFSDKPIEEIRADMERFKQTDPIKAYGAEIIGSLITGGIGAARAVGTAIGREAIKRATAFGGAEGALYGIGTGTTPEERVRGAGIGAPIGAIGGGIGQAFMPTLQKGAQSMLSRGYPLTAGQAYGGTVGSIEQKISAPFVQERIARARREPQLMFVRETVNEALSPLGVKVPEGMTGEEAVQYASSKISEAYQKVVPEASLKTSVVDSAIKNIIDNRLKSGVFDAKDVTDFNKELADVYNRFKRNGAMTGELFKEAESKMSRQINAFYKNNQRRQAEALKEIQSVFRSELAKQNPTLPDLQAANQAFRNLDPIETVSKRAFGSQGVFTPVALGKEEMKKRPLTSPQVVRAQEARDVLGATVPDSGTAGRLEVSEAFTSPKAALGLGGKLLASSLFYDFPKLGRGLARAPAGLIGYGSPAAGALGAEPLLDRLGLLGE